MKYLLRSTLLIQGVKVDVALGVSDADYCALLTDPYKCDAIARDLAHDLIQLRLTGKLKEKKQWHQSRSR
jgi:hypothetical protein